MTCHCGLGLSARAIAYAGHVDHPGDPSDLLRCINYRKESGLTIGELRKRMTGRSVAWDALVAHWAELEGLLDDEMSTRTDGCAPSTHARMRELLREVGAA